MDPIVALSDALESLPREQALERICVTTAQEIPRANLVSLWTFDATLTEIQCIKSYDASLKSFSSGQSLHKRDFPSYFDAIVEQQVVNASDARNHSMTNCFNEAYFIPNDIYSLLDFILHKQFRPTGIICCESKGEQVEWIEQDIETIQAIAAMVSFCFDV